MTPNHRNSNNRTNKEVVGIHNTSTTASKTNTKSSALLTTNSENTRIHTTDHRFYGTVSGNKIDEESFILSDTSHHTLATTSRSNSEQSLVTNILNGATGFERASFEQGKTFPPSYQHQELHLSSAIEIEPHMHIDTPKTIPDFSCSRPIGVSNHSTEEEEDEEMPTSRFRRKKGRAGAKKKKSDPETSRLLHRDITTSNSIHHHDNYESDWDKFNTSKGAALRGPIKRSRKKTSKNKSTKIRTSVTNQLPTVIENDIDEDDITYLATQFLSTVDSIEDRFDRNTYEELIPLNIRMELENRLFGWNHLYSEFLGHICFPLLYYTVTFWIVSMIGLRYIPSNERYCHTYCGTNCIYHKIYFNGNHTVMKNVTCDNDYEYRPIFGLSNHVFLTLRQILSIWSAFNAFRTVRRRRRVWLRSTAAEYFKDEKKQDEMKEVDKKTLLGRIRRRLRARKIRKKLRKAQKSFQRRDTIRMKKIISNINSFSFESDHHMNVRSLSGVSSHDDGSVSSDISNWSQHYAPNEPDPNHLFNAYQKYKHAGQDHSINDANESSKPFYARTMPTFAMQSINMDQIRLESRIDNIAYAHGGFFGAAPFMLANPHWYVFNFAFFGKISPHMNTHFNTHFLLHLSNDQ